MKNRLASEFGIVKKVKLSPICSAFQEDKHLHCCNYARLSDDMSILFLCSYNPGEKLACSNYESCLIKKILLLNYVRFCCYVFAYVFALSENCLIRHFK